MGSRPHAERGHSPPLFYIVDWLPPDFGAVGQYALNAAREIAAEGRRVHLVGLTSGPASFDDVRFPETDGQLTIERLHANPYEKTRMAHRLAWALATNSRLIRAVLRHPRARGADVYFTGAPPFMLFFAMILKGFRRARVTYRITDFYPEAIVAHLGRRPRLVAMIEHATWFLRRRVDAFEVLGEDQRGLLVSGGVDPARIVLKRDSAPVAVTGNETPAPRPPALGNHKVLLYSGNYGVAHEAATVAEGLARHHGGGNGRFALWLNASGRNADWLARRLGELGVPFAHTPPVALNELAGVLAAADAHLIALRPRFAGIVFPSKVYGCLLSKRPIVFVGPEESDVHLLCQRSGQIYLRVAPGDADGFARALDALATD